MRNEVWIDNIFANYSYQKFLTNDTLKFAFLLCLVTEFGYFCTGTKTSTLSPALGIANLFGKYVPQKY